MTRLFAAVTGAVTACALLGGALLTNAPAAWRTPTPAQTAEVAPVVAPVPATDTAAPAIPFLPRDASTRDPNAALLAIAATTAQMRANETAEGDTPLPPALSQTAEAAATAGTPAPTFDDIIAKARTLAAAPYAARDASLPERMAALGYDGYRSIRFLPTNADWADDTDTPFHLEYAPQGFLFDAPVAVNLITGDTVARRTFDASEFDFGGLDLSDEEKAALGFSGLRVTAPLNTAGVFDEILSFQGASFFRALGMGNSHGASARAITIRTASPQGEEFPSFTEFWLKRPASDEVSLEIYALLDGESVSGAYRFRLTPGVHTVMDIEAALFPRRELTEVGVAPLTSMFDFGPQDPAPGRQDARPAVHDSDGLMMRLRNGEWVWRPLINPTRLEVSSFAEQTPRGFGLMQRERDVDAFQDFEARYHKRPSVWVTPRDDWGTGRLVLVEIPTENEFNDNIVAFWRPDAPWTAGSEQKIAYRLSWGAGPPVQPGVATVSQTRTGKSIHNDNRLFIIDFDVQHQELFDGAVPVVSTSAGAVVGTTLIAHPDGSGYRLTFELDAKGTDVAELRAVVLRAGRPLTETWLYRWRRT